MRNALLALTMGLTMTLPAQSASVVPQKDPDTGWTIYALSAGDTTALVSPDAGANVYSIAYKGTEILRKPESLDKLPGFMYGTPVLYPTPNRVRDSVFTFRGRKYEFTPNNNKNFLHGLVHNVRWKAGRSFATSRTEGGKTTHTARLEMSLDCGESAPFHKLFPHPHALKLTITVTNNAVRWDYAVDNSAGTTHVPFGFALHPWFLYQGERKETLLTVPATHWMEAVNLLPTGKLIALEETKLDARKGRSLEGFVIDDVYFGLRPDAPTRIEFRDKGLAIDLAASADFTHLVVYTPEGQPWFCVENQTCSTDAHNLHENGLKRESNLLIVEPGKSHSGWIEYRITESK